MLSNMTLHDNCRVGNFRLAIPFLSLLTMQYWLKYRTTFCVWLLLHVLLWVRMHQRPTGRTLATAIAN